MARCCHSERVNRSTPGTARRQRRIRCGATPENGFFLKNATRSLDTRRPRRAEVYPLLMNFHLSLRGAQLATKQSLTCEGDCFAPPGKPHRAPLAMTRRSSCASRMSPRDMEGLRMTEHTPGPFTLCAHRCKTLNHTPGQAGVKWLTPRRKDAKRGAERAPRPACRRTPTRPGGAFRYSAVPSACADGGGRGQIGSSSPWGIASRSMNRKVFPAPARPRRGATTKPPVVVPVPRVVPVAAGAARLRPIPTEQRLTPP
jgi:hypothetical protein